MPTGVRSRLHLLGLVFAEQSAQRQIDDVPCGKLMSFGDRLDLAP
jgi:hypothetical protein